MNGTHRLLVYIDSLLGENIKTKKQKHYLVTSKEVGLEVNTKKEEEEVYIHVS